MEDTIRLQAILAFIENQLAERTVDEYDDGYQDALKDIRDLASAR